MTDDRVPSLSFIIHHSSFIIYALRILGIDPGLNITGYGVLEAGRWPLAASARRAWSAATPRGSLTKRLLEIHEGVADVIASLKPEVMALEELYSHYDRPRTAILMGHARGVICLAAAQAGIPVVHYSATQIKRILTGSGRAPKVAGAAGHPARAVAALRPRPARRGRRPGRRTVPLLLERQTVTPEEGIVHQEAVGTMPSGFEKQCP